jgi:3'-phosphoadenosine 5'-phosphosulfate sulfotransferase (PAPS reductase)/FAD synthetase
MKSLDTPPRNFKLPQANRHIIPVSGGADSTVLALWMSRHFDVQFEYIFCDTGAEPETLYKTLELLEDALGKPIVRLAAAGGGLYDYVEKQGGYLPSASSRWCTRILKALPLQEWMKGQSEPTNMYVGIRSDERTRLGLALPGVSTWFPFVEEEWVRSEVFSALRDSIGIPSFYKVRTRSGCAPCPFQRRAEFAGLLEQDPKEFQIAAEYEKISEADRMRHAEAPKLCDDTGWTRNHFGFPLPTAEFQGGKKPKGADLFGMAGVFVAAEFFRSSFPGTAPFTWGQRLVSYSTSLGGIKKQIDSRWAHLGATFEAWDLTAGDLDDVVYAIYYFEAPASEFDPNGTGPTSFTWQAGQSLLQLRHILGWAERVLHAATLQTDAEAVGNHRATSWGYEQAQLSQVALDRVSTKGRPIGHLVESGLYRPRELTVDDELDERFITCAACSI